MRLQVVTLNFIQNSNKRLTLDLVTKNKHDDDYPPPLPLPTQTNSNPNQKPSIDPIRNHHHRLLKPETINRHRPPKTIEEEIIVRSCRHLNQTQNSEKETRERERC
ncbi:hypothetical protein LWI29_020530 [Acer saccharum]|uniref:Uncharacterized protein n=1 Tax=Acer saccharum TaxID=4024 RepID=A0AA39VDU3_ACESA|nr:hypothetical protein LWI29_020530 [Acer saccharum]